MHVEVVDFFEAVMMMNENEYRKWADINDGGSHYFRSVEVNAISGEEEWGPFGRPFYRPLSITVRIVGDWRGALQDYVSIAYMEGCMTDEEARHLTALAEQPMELPA